MNMHILVLSLLGAVLVGSALLVYRLTRYRRRKRAHDEVVDRAVAQMRQTGIFLALGMNPNPEDIAKLQARLKHDWGYEGEIDGHPNTEMLDAIERMAQARGIDVDSEVLSLFPPSRSTEVLPAPIRQEVVLDLAQKRLSEARGGHQVA